MKSSSVVGPCRIGSVPQNFAGSCQGLASRVCRFGSGRSGLVAIPSTCIFRFFFLHKNLSKNSSKVKIMTHLPLRRKENVVNWHSCQSKFCPPIFFVCKIWGRIRMWIGIVLMPIRIRIWIGILMEIRIRICRSTTLESSNKHWTL